MFSFHNLVLLLSTLLYNLLISQVAAAPVEGNVPTPLQERQSPATPHPLDYAPDFLKDPFPPYPPVYNEDGSNITVENWRGTKLFGWKGCENNEKEIIVQAFKDFVTLAQQKELWENIDWDSPAAKEIWGHSTDDRKAVQDDRKKQIKRKYLNHLTEECRLNSDTEIYEASQQIYDKNWWVPPYIYDPPWVAWRNLWIRVQCSPDGDEQDACGDKPVKDPKCPKGTPPSKGKSTGLEAFSNPLGFYSKITFCSGFFNGFPDESGRVIPMRSLSEVVATAKRNSRSYQNDLWNYQNRARVVFHEITHLNYFMNAPKESPFVDDIKIKYKVGGGSKAINNVAAYGPENIKILANYEAVGRGGFYTQRNADSYAWFAMAKYLEKEMGSYPSDPVENRRPSEAPKDGDGKKFPGTLDVEDGNNVDAADADAEEGEVDSKDHYIPGCPDHASIDSETFGVTTVNNDAKTECDTNALSGIPYNVFSGLTSVYDKFCFALDSTANLKWTVDAHGEERRASKIKRTPPPNPDSYPSYSFELTWEKNEANEGCGQNIYSCRQAFARIATSPCGHQGGEQNGMTASGKIELPNCGTYSYKIIGENVPPANTPTPDPPQRPPPSLGNQWCYPADTFGDHEDTHESVQSGWTEIFCRNNNKNIIKDGDPGSNIHVVPDDGLYAFPWTYDVFWEQDCKSTMTEMTVGKPLADRDDVTCESLMKNNYKKCNNGGIGGKISVGCLMYRWKASLEDK